MNLETVRPMFHDAQEQQDLLELAYLLAIPEDDAIRWFLGEDHPTQMEAALRARLPECSWFSSERLWMEILALKTYLRGKSTVGYKPPPGALHCDLCKERFARYVATPVTALGTPFMSKPSTKLLLCHPCRSSQKSVIPEDFQTQVVILPIEIL